jgi:hypothetical protein
MLACLILAIYFQHRCTILLAEEEMVSLLVAATVMILALVANLASTGKPIIQRKHCCGPVSMGFLVSYPDLNSQSGSRRAKMTRQHRKKLINFIS